MTNGGFTGATPDPDQPPAEVLELAPATIDRRWLRLAGVAVALLVLLGGGLLVSSRVRAMEPTFSRADITAGFSGRTSTRGTGTGWQPDLTYTDKAGAGAGGADSVDQTKPAGCESIVAPEDLPGTLESVSASFDGPEPDDDVEFLPGAVITARYPDPAAARKAFRSFDDAVRRCSRFTVGGSTFGIERAQVGADRLGRSETTFRLTVDKLSRPTWVTAVRYGNTFSWMIASQADGTESSVDPVMADLLVAGLQDVYRARS